MKPFNTAAKTNQLDRFGDNVYDKFSVGFGIIDMATETVDYNISSTGVAGDNLPNFMVIIPETAGVIVVELIGMTEGNIYTITAAQITANLGIPLLYKVRKVVKSGTTATFSAIW